MKKPGKIMIGLILLIFVVYQLVQIYYRPIDTVSANFFETYEGIDTVGVAIREEHFVYDTAGGVKSYAVSDGERISKGGTLAKVFADSDAASKETRIENLNREIANLEEIAGYSNIESSNLDLLDSKIRASLSEVIENAKDGDFTDTEGSKGELVKLLNRRQVIIGKATDFGGMIASLKAERDQILSTASGASSSITSEVSGYFVSSVDGYEGVLTYEGIANLTPEALESVGIEKKETDPNVIGKVVSDYNWYIASVVEFSESLKFKKGDSATLKTTLESMSSIPVKVDRIIRGDSGDKSVIVFRCDYMNGELAAMRTQPMTIVLNEYSGLKIDSKALKFVDGIKGVYVLSNSLVKFVPVEVVFSGDDYVICKQESESGKLRLYDEVIVKGKNLYDGKLVD